MKPSLFTPFILLAAAAAQAGDAVPTWELGKNPIAATAMTGKVEVIDGVVRLDGTNSFTIPATALGKQEDYTIEFEVKRPADIKEGITLVSNADAAAKAGLAVRYFAPAYNAIWLMCNGNQTGEFRSFLGEDWTKVTITAKDRRLSLFKNGLILANTDAVLPSSLPLTFGEVLKSAIAPYEIRKLRIYDQPLFPTGFDPSVERMRNFSGDQFFMQRVDVKDATLPRMLVIGDSISMAYRRHITDHFKGKAYVDYWVQGFLNWDGENSAGERAFNGALAQGPYDVVTFNFGLHWWSPQHPTRAPDDKFPALAEKMVQHLRKIAPATRFIWVRTTPYTTVVEGQPIVIDAVKSERLVKNNAITDGIMAKAGIPEVDLWAICEKNLDKAGKDGVHWNEAAAKLFATDIIAAIEKELKAKQAK